MYNFPSGVYYLGLVAIYFEFRHYDTVISPKVYRTYKANIYIHIRKPRSQLNTLKLLKNLAFRFSTHYPVF